MSVTLVNGEAQQDAPEPGAAGNSSAEFDWDEHEHCPSSERKIEGRGFFLYDLPNKDGPAQLFGRRYLTARPFHQSDDDSYGWLNVEERNDPWTAIEILPR